jgi:DNA-binding CsgD family transcriptional regulator
VGIRVGDSTLIGRQAELAELEQLLDVSVAGEAVMVVVGGDAGIGKTRLVEELCRRARARGAFTATGVCVPTDGGGLPYGPVVALVRDMVRQLGPRDEAQLLTPVARMLGMAGWDEGDGSPQLAKTRLFELMLQACTAIAQQSPLVLLVEDLQWSDSGSRELLDHLTRNLGDAPVLVVGTYRTADLDSDHPLHRWVGEIGRHRHGGSLELAGMTRDEIAELIDQATGAAPDTELLDAVWTRSQGNPFFAEELAVAGTDGRLPSGLQAAIAAGVQALSDDARRLLGAVAVAGLEVDHDLLDAISPLDEEALDRALAETLAAHVLVLAADTGYRFRHALLREAIEAQLLPSERRRLHRRLAEVLTADPSLGSPGPGHRAAALAGHWWAAGQWDEAFAASMEAADAANALWAFREEFAQLDRALAAFEKMPVAPDDVTHLELLERASEAGYLGGLPERCVELIRAAIAETDDPIRAGRLHAFLGRNAWSIGNSDMAFEAYARAIELLPADQPTEELALALAEHARGYMLLSRFQEAEERCGEAISVAQQAGARAVEGHAINTLGTCIASLGRVDEGLGLLREALAIAEELERPEDLDRAYTNLAYVLANAGRNEEAVGLMDDNRATVEQMGYLMRGGGITNTAEVLTELGRYDEAEALLAQIGRLGIGNCTTGPLGPRLLVALDRGRYDEVPGLLADIELFTADLTDAQNRGGYHVMEAKVALALGRPDDAWPHVEQGLTFAAGTDDEVVICDLCTTGVRTLADQLATARGHGRRFDPEKAELLADGLIAELERLLDDHTSMGGLTSPRSLASKAMAVAERSRLTGSDPELWASAAEQWTAISMPYPAAVCRWREAEALLERRAERARAVDALQQAWRSAVTMGVPPLQSCIEDLARRARIELGDAASVEPDPVRAVAVDLGLTPREIEVLGLLATGCTDREIAETLYISKKTASVHVSNLLRKLDVSNRVEAGRIGQAHGLG